MGWSEQNPLQSARVMSPVPNYEPKGPALAQAMSPPSGSGENGKTNKAAPADGGTSGSQPGGGGTNNAMKILQSAPEDLKLEAAQQAAGAVSSQSGKTKEAGEEAIKMKGEVNKLVGGAKLYEAMKKESFANLDYQLNSGKINKRQYNGWKNKWKNIFQIVPEEDFGMFMMDFGLRMMALSGQGETIGTSIGGAGQGALAGVQERGRYKQGFAMETEKLVADDAWRKTQLQTRPPNYLETMEGIYESGPGGALTQVVDPKTGAALTPSSSYNRPYAKQWEIQQWKSAFPGMSDAEATTMALSGVTPQKAEQEAKSDFSADYRSGNVFIPGKGRVSARNITDADRDAYIKDRAINIAGGSSGGTRSSGSSNGAVSGSAGGGGLTPEEQEELARLEAEFGQEEQK